MATVQSWQSVVEERLGVISRETPGHRLSRLAFTHHINCLAPDLALFPNPYNDSQPEPEYEILPDFHHLFCTVLGIFYRTSLIVSENKRENITLKLDLGKHWKTSNRGLSALLNPRRTKAFQKLRFDQMGFSSVSLERKLKNLNFVVIKTGEKIKNIFRDHKETLENLESWPQRTPEPPSYQGFSKAQVRSDGVFQCFHKFIEFNDFKLIKNLIYSFCCKSNNTQGEEISLVQVSSIHSSRNYLMSHISYAHHDKKMISKLMALSESPEPKISRLLLDSTVTLTYNSNLNTGIQRVVRRLSEQCNSKTQTIEEKAIFYDHKALTYRDENNMFIIPNSKDTIVMLDSNWEIIHSMKSEIKRSFLCRSRLITCIHDMIPLHYPGMVVSRFSEKFVSWLKFILLYSDFIICVSRAVADEVYTFLKEISFPHQVKIGFWKLGADMLESSRFCHAQYSTNKSNHLVFITVGTLEIRKGHHVILEAFEEIWSEDQGIKLHLVGTHNSTNRHFIERLKQHPELGKHLHWHERLDDHGLAELYANADALILASYAEGFGLPIAEAGYFGKPVIVSDLPVFREVSAAAPKAFFFTPGSAQDLAAQIRNFIRESQNGTLTKSKPVAWPTWAESMDQLRSVVLKDQYYKIYQPKVKQDPFRINYIGEIYTQSQVLIIDQKYNLHLFEPPFKSQRKDSLDVILFVKNLSDQLYASNQDLDYKLGIRLGARPAQDNSMATGYVPSFADIPFVLLPGHQLVMRISCPWTNHPRWRNRITAVEIDLLQVLPDGYNWWGQSPLRVELPTHGR